MHYGLLPRANRGIFAINELPDLAGKIQVGLFNILQEGDVQIKGYPIRLQLDVLLVFTANPEDYTARGKIITPLKDRIGSEIRTHYPATRQQRDGDHRAGSVDRSRPAALKVEIPAYVREVVEEVAFQARADRKIDKRSGVSQRLPITSLELVVSNAERRALANGETLVVPRVTDVYAALPSITGKFELEYEGELRGAEQVARDLIRVGGRQRLRRRVRRRRHAQRSSSGSTSAARCRSSDTTSADELLAQTRGVQGLRRARRAHRPAGRRVRRRRSRRPSTSCSKACTRRRRSAAATSAAIAAAEAAPRRPTRREEPAIDEEIRMPGGKKKYYN